MPDIFATGSAWLRDQLGDHASREITLHDPHTGKTWTIPATPGSTQWEEDPNEGTVVRTESRDWIVSTAKLDDILGKTRPARGWIITDSLDHSRYQVGGPDGTPWDYSDTAHHLIRIRSLSLTAEQ